MSVVVNKLAFGSCNKQKKLQTHWEVIAKDQNPDFFFWTGDAGYGKSNSIEGMTEALLNLTTDERYRGFTQNGVEVDGIWDDHDFGVNDGGI